MQQQTDHQIPSFCISLFEHSQIYSSQTAMNMFYSSRKNNSYNMTSKPEREILS